MDSAQRRDSESRDTENRRTEKRTQRVEILSQARRDQRHRIMDKKIRRDSMCRNTGSRDAETRTQRSLTRHGHRGTDPKLMSERPEQIE
jgi:hypothetical protein